MGDNDTAMGESTSSHSLGALDRSKRKAASPLQGPASKRPNLEHNNRTREELTPSPTSLSLRRSKRKIAQRPALKRPHTYRPADRYIINANNASTCR